MNYQRTFVPLMLVTAMIAFAGPVQAGPDADIDSPIDTPVCNGMVSYDCVCGNDVKDCQPGDRCRLYAHVYQPQCIIGTLGTLFA